jgi:uncharacterized protein YqjF (DUF2071 family)/predicted DCC family thiol-disulfide oxidoreductase YuxK
MAGQHLILFDGDCGFCRRVVAWLGRRDRGCRFRAIPYQEAPAPPMTPALAEACRRAVHVQRNDGRILRGGRAVLFILEQTGMGFPARIAACPPLVWIVELGYRLVASHRSFFGRFLFTRSAPAASPGQGVDRAALARRPARIPVLRQQWQHLSFLHWPVDAGALQRLLPAGLTVDTFQGQAFVGLVPFTMGNVRPAPLPPVPGLSHFHEFNVRTYVLDRQGRPGVWFFSLDAASRVAVTLGRRWFKLPYFLAEMELGIAGGNQRHYRCARMGPFAAGCDLLTTFSGAARPAIAGTLEHFLIERYFLFTHSSEGLLRGQVHHSPYLVQTARAELRSETLLAAAGIARPESAPLVHYSAGVEVEVFGLQPVEPG